MNEELSRGFRLRNWEIWPLRNLIVGPDGKHHLEPKTMQVLVALAKQRDEVVTRETLLNEVWPETYSGEESLTRSISKLRSCFSDEPANSQFIETIPKTGYRLLAPVDPLAVEETLSSAQVSPPSRSATRHLIVWTSGILVAGALIAAVGLNLGEMRDRLMRGAEAPITSIAVLPLENLAPDPEAEQYFADGMTEALTAELGQISALKVISRTSAMHYKDTGKRLPEIARELGVEGLIEGSVLRAGDEVRITLQLIHGPADQHLWSETYERDVRDILALQSEVARAVANEIAVTITGAEDTRLARTQAVDPDAYQLWLKGNHVMGFTEESARRAIGFYQEALAIDPAYAPAHAGIAWAYALLGSWFGSVDPQDVIPRAREAAEQALALDSAAEEAHLALALIRFWYEWDWDGAERAFSRAIALNPSYSSAYSSYAHFLNAVGRFGEAIEMSSRALDLDPLDPTSYFEQAVSLDLAGRDEEAMERYRQGFELDPGHHQGHVIIVDFHYARRGKFDQALSHLAQARATQDTPHLLAKLGYLYGAAGRTTEARAVLSQLIETRKQANVPAPAVARVYLGLGEHEEALRWLETAYEERDMRLVWLKVRWEYDPLRNYPRFQDLLHRMNFPEP